MTPSHVRSLMATANMYSNWVQKRLPDLPEVFKEGRNAMAYLIGCTNHLFGYDHLKDVPDKCYDDYETVLKYFASVANHKSAWFEAFSKFKRDPLKTLDLSNRSMDDKWSTKAVTYLKSLHKSEK